MKYKPRCYPPLPFAGCKRSWIKALCDVFALLQLEQKITKNTIIIDLFGGSGIVSHNLKQLLKEPLIIWNDFDNYKERLDNIHLTEQVRLKILELGFNSFVLRWNTKAFYKTKKISTQSTEFFDYERDAIKRYLKQKFDNNEYLDHLSISSFLLFGGNYLTIDKMLNKSTFYAQDIAKRLNCDGYLEGVERVSVDFRELCDKYQRHDDVIWIVDPPYEFSNSFHYAEKTKPTAFLIDFLKDKKYLFFNKDFDKFVKVFNLPKSMVNATRIGKNFTIRSNDRASEFMITNLY